MIERLPGLSVKDLGKVTNAGSSRPKQQQISNTKNINHGLHPPIITEQRSQTQIGKNRQSTQIKNEQTLIGLVF